MNSPTFLLRNRSALVLLLSSSLASAPWSQVQSACSSLSAHVPGDAACLPLPESGDFGAIAAKDLDGDLQPEFATLRGTDLFLTLGSDYLGQVTPSFLVSGGVLDVCADPTGASFLFTHALGLQRLTLFNDGVSLYPVVSLLSSAGDWPGASLVRAGNGPAGSATFFGVSADKKRLFSAPASAPTTPTLLFQLGALPTFVDLQPLNWDADVANGDEFATLTSTGMQIRQQSPPVTLIARAAAVPGDAIATVNGDGNSDAAVWATRNVDDTQNLLVFHKDFSPVYQVQMQNLLPSERIHTISKADLDNDKDEDLILSSLSNYELRVVFNQKPGSSWSGAFSTFSGYEVEMGAPGVTSPNTGRAVAVPIWNTPLPGSNPSGAVYVDFALGVGGLHALRRVPWDYYYPTPRADEQALLVTKFAGRFQRMDYIPCPGEEAWLIKFGVGWGLNLNANAVQVKLLYYDYNGVQGTNHTYTGPYPLYHRMYEFPAPLLSLQNQWARLEVNAPPADAAYFAMVRPVRLAPNDTIQQAWNWALVSMTTDMGTDAWLDFLSPSHMRVNEGWERQDCDPTPAPGGGNWVRLIPHPILQSDYPSTIPAGTLGGLPQFGYFTDN